MGYLFETHMHTSEGSACAVSSGKEEARAYFEKGYSGIVVTDHFFNGNCAIEKDLPWKERVDLFVRGYENAKDEGDKLGLCVFFGFEYFSDGAEVLVYGVEPNFLYDNENLDKIGIKKLAKLVREAGGITSLAHPFRECDYLYGIRLFVETDAVESVNAAHRNNPEFNRRAYEFALDRGKFMTAGSDLHRSEDVSRSGMMFDNEIKTPADFVAAVKAGEYKIMLYGEEYKYTPKDYLSLM